MKSRRIRVLFIEDDKVDQIAFKRSVKEDDLPYDYTLAGSVSEAKKILGSERFDIVVTDYLLGDGTAFDIFDSIKDTPIVFVTGAGDQEIAVEAIKRGASDYVVKDLERNYLRVLPLTVEASIKRKKEEKQLKLLSHAIMSINDSVYITDTEDKITFVNKAFCETYRYEEKDILGKRSSVLSTPESPSRISGTISSPACENTFRWEIYHKRKDGTKFPVSLSRSSVQSENGTEVFIVCVARDVTDRKRAEERIRESEKKYRTLVETAQEGIAVVDLDENLLFVNQAFADALGYQKEELIGLNLRQVTDDKQFAAFQKGTEDRKKRKSARYETRFRTKDGDIKFFNLSVSPLYDGADNVTALMGLLADVTEQKTLQQQISEYARHLEETVENLKDTQNKLVEARKLVAVGRLAAGVAHELNNPLGGILGYSQFALEKMNEKPISQFDQEDTATFLQYLQDIEHQTKRCRFIVRDLLDFSHLSRTEELEPLNVDLDLEQAIKLAASQLEENKIALVKKLTEPLPRIHGNSSHLQQVFINLISNAVQAMPEGGTLTIASRIGGDQRTVELSFTDTGVGIPEKDLEKIFEPFFTTKKPGEGTGLGLAVSYGLVKNLGGDIKVKSKKSQGATFTVILPVAGEEEISESKDESRMAVSE
jgi:PAS domain S-box-containing protein